MADSPESIKPYDQGSSKAEQVEAMFDNIAPSYDFMNTAMTFGLHRSWLKKALDKVHDMSVADNGQPSILDIATGTGDVAFRLAALFPQADITGVDLSEGMLAVARRKLEELPAEEASRIRFLQGNGLDLSFPDASFNLITIAYGVRNFENLKKGFEEFFRTLKPGAKCMILELSRPENPVIRLGYDLYSRLIIPFIGRLVSKDRRAYSYLPQSIAAMPSRKKMAEMLRDAGFRNVFYKPLTMGVVTYYIAEK